MDGQILQPAYTLNKFVKVVGSSPCVVDFSHFKGLCLKAENFI